MSLRPELEPPPERIARLPVHRGYPVPWFVEWVRDGEQTGAPIGEGEPHFEIMSRQRFSSAVRDQRCWVCGGKLGGWRAFVIGPMCAVNHTSAEPPSHVECAEWSARNCPFLSRPRMTRRKAGIIEDTVKAPGVALMRNPGVGLVWKTRQGLYRIRSVSDGLLFDIGDPLGVSWWAEGRPATRAEIEESIESGLPSLMEMAQQEGPSAVASLGRYVDRAMTLLPAA